VGVGGDGRPVSLAPPAGAARPDEIRAVPLRRPGRWAAAAVALVLVAMLVNSMATNPRYEWGLVGHWLFQPVILSGVVATLELTGLAMAIGIVRGIVLAVMRLSPSPLLSGVSWLYIWVFRGTPVYVQIFLWYDLSYLYPKLGLGVPFGPVLLHASTNAVITPLSAAVLALGLNEAAYYAEIVRAGILAVEHGQTEAAQSLGLRRMQIMRKIVLPQAMRVIIPPTGNETISMLKTSSLASAATFAELFFQTQQLMARTYVTIPFLLMASIWYLAMTTALTIPQYYLERHFARGSLGTRQPRFWQALGENFGMAPWRRRKAYTASSLGASASGVPGSGGPASGVPGSGAAAPRRGEPGNPAIRR
jgi:polar amino acid transport system permease protein